MRLCGGVCVFRAAACVCGVVCHCYCHRSYVLPPVACFTRSQLWSDAELVAAGHEGSGGAGQRVAGGLLIIDMYTSNMYTGNMYT